jgi:hypothetical protein
VFFAINGYFWDYLDIFGIICAKLGKVKFNFGQNYPSHRELNGVIILIFKVFAKCSVIIIICG